MLEQRHICFASMDGTSPGQVLTYHDAGSVA
jgi:hypothetical protein